MYAKGDIKNSEVSKIRERDPEAFDFLNRLLRTQNNNGYGFDFAKMQAKSNTGTNNQQ